MRELIPVENDSTVARDPVSNAIISVDKNRLNSYKKQKELFLSKEEKIDMLFEKINNLETLLQRMLNNGNNNH
jgi:hypothetical protein